MKKGILIIVAIILMILAVIPVVDYYLSKNLVYSKGEISTAQDYISIKNGVQSDLFYSSEFVKTFFVYFDNVYAPASGNSVVFNALYELSKISDASGGTIFEQDTGNVLFYISYISDLFLIWFVLFAILQVPIFTMRLMGLKEDKGGKRLWDKRIKKER